nr:MAG TPA: Protein of unknown function (DUF2634) [Caudoviricetes sp.]
MSVLKTYRTLKNGRPTTRTYQLDLENKRLGRRIAENVEAMNQAIFLILAIERFDYKIYSYDYGVELEELIGKRRSYVEADIRRRLDEALMQDDRILGTKDFSFSMDRENIEVTFTAVTIFGDVPIERRFTIGYNQIR